MALRDSKEATKKNRYSDAQVLRILRKTDQHPAPEMAKRDGVGGQRMHGWRKRFAGMAADDVKEPNDLTPECPAEETADRAGW